MGHKPGAVTPLAASAWGQQAVPIAVTQTHMEARMKHPKALHCQRLQGKHCTCATHHGATRHGAHTTACAVTVRAQHTALAYLLVHSRSHCEIFLARRDRTFQRGGKETDHANLRVPLPA